MGDADFSTLTNSASKTYLSCGAKYRFAYDLQLKPPGERAPALRFGSAWHALMEASRHLIMRGVGYDEAHTLLKLVVTRISSLERDLTEQEVGALEGMLEAYSQRYWVRDQGKLADRRISEVIKVEHAFDVPLRNPATGRQSRTFRFMGVIDGIVRDQLGDMKILETKTTSSIDGAYLEVVQTQIQTWLYTYGGKHHYKEISGWIYDVAKKPSIRLRKGEDREEYSFRVKQKSLEPEGSITIEKEHDQDKVDEAMATVWRISEKIREDRRRGFVRNTQACFDWHRPCEFMSICIGRDIGHDEDDVAVALGLGYTVKEARHEEWSEEPADIVKWMLDQLDGVHDTEEEEPLL